MATTEYRASISGVSTAKPCVVTTSAAHGFQTGQRVRITDLGNPAGTNRGMVQINQQDYDIVVASTTTFELWNTVTQEQIDSTDYDPWVSGGSVNMITRALALNYPQQRPYSASSPYDSNATIYEAD